MKILEISSYPPPRAGWGMRIYFLKCVLEQAGHTCTVLNIGKGRFLRDRDFLPVLGPIDYVVKILRHRLRGYLVHMHLNGDSPKGFVLAMTALALSLLTGRRPVITFHAGPVQKYFPRHRAPWLTPMYKLIFAAPRHIICNHDAVKAAIVSYGVRPGKIVPIPAFSRQYLSYEVAPLTPGLRHFLHTHDPVISSYVFFRQEFFVSEMLRAIRRLVERFPGLGLLVMGSDHGAEAALAQIGSLGLGDHVLLAGDQDHDTFLTILTRSHLYLRTPVKDGVASSVLEALALDTPVVASENGLRPPSVVTYRNQDLDDMTAKIAWVLEHHAEAVTRIVKPRIRDTIADEIAVLSGNPAT